MAIKLITAVVVLLTCFTTVIAQQASLPKVRIINYQGDMTGLLVAMPNSYGATVGLELAADQPNALVRVVITDPTLPEVMNAIVRSAPKYQWREAYGVVEVWPLVGSNPLLETPINYFNATDTNPAQAVDQLFKSPEVQANMKAMNLKRRAPDSAESKTPSQSFSVNLTGITLRQALHKIAQESGIKFWVFRNYPNGFFSISFVDR